MGNVGFTEILVVLVVALIVLGPNRLPGAARQLGKALSEFRRVSNDLQAEVRDAFSEPGPYAPPPTATEATGTPPPGAPSPVVDMPELPTRPEDAELPSTPPAPVAQPPAPDERPS